MVLILLQFSKSLGPRRVYPVICDTNTLKCNLCQVKEAVAYKKNFPKFDSIPFEPKTAEAAMRKAIESCSKDGNLIILGIGFTSNIAAVMDAIQSNNVNRIVLMGGWFEDDKGEIKRVGYNTVVDLQASKRVLEQKNVPVSSPRGIYIALNAHSISGVDRQLGSM